VPAVHQTRTYQGKCPGRNTFTLAAALAVKSVNSKIIYKDILIALADATNDLSMPYHEHRTGAETGYPVIFLNLKLIQKM